MNVRRCALLSVLLCVLLAATAAQQPTKRPITEKDLFAFNWVADPQVSADGTRVAFVRVTANEKRDGYNTAIWMVSTRGGEAPVRLTTGPRDTSPRWSADGKRLLFLRAPEQAEGERQGAERDKGGPQIALLDLGGGEPWILTSLPGGAEDPAFSPDGKTILFLSRTNAEDIARAEKKKRGELSPDSYESDVRVISRAIYRFNGAGYLDPKHQKHLWTVAVPPSPDVTNQPRQLTTGVFDEDSAQWSPDGSLIYFTSTRVSEPYYDPQVATLFSMPASGGEPKKIMTMAANLGPYVVSQDGKRIVFEASPSKPVVSYSETHLYLVDAGGGEARNVAPTLDKDVGGGMIGDQHPPRGGNGTVPIWRDGAVLDIVADGGTNNLFRFDLAGGKITPLTTGAHDIFALAASPDGKTVVAGISSATAVGDLYNVSGAQPVRLTNFNETLFSGLVLPEPEQITYSSFDGRKIEAWVYKPPDFDPAKKYPLILNIHGGPHAAYGHTFVHEFFWMAAKGYVVLAPNPRGSSNYGQDFGNIIQYKYPGDDFKDLMAGVDELLRRGYIDPKKLGVTGGSGGGLLTNWVITQTDRFAAAVSQRDIADWGTFWYTADFTLFTPFWFRGAPWEQRDDFAARSPITHIAKVKTPLMLVLGDADYRTPPAAGGEQMFRALKFLKVPTVMVRFPGESHELSRSGKPWHRVERLQHIVNWFDRYLMGKPMPQYEVLPEQPVRPREEQQSPPAAERR